MKWGVLALSLFAVLGLARADDSRVTIELRSGDRVTGTLVGFSDHRYRVKIADNVLGLREEDIRVIDFGERAPEAGVEPVLSSTSLSAEDVAALASGVEINLDGLFLDKEHARTVKDALGVEGLTVVRTPITLPFCGDEWRVEATDPGSRAGKLGFRAGDRIQGVRVDQRSSSSIGLIAQAALGIARARGREIALDIERGHERLDVALDR